MTDHSENEYDLVKDHQSKFEDIFTRLRQLDTHSRDIAHLQEGYVNIISKLDKLEQILINRLPLWATILLGGLIGLCTTLVTVVLKK